MVARRNILDTLASAAIASALPILPTLAAHAAPKKSDRRRPRWSMDGPVDDRREGARARHARLTLPTPDLSPDRASWTPNLSEAGKYQAVEVPTGLVTDFASAASILFDAAPRWRIRLCRGSRTISTGPRYAHARKPTRFSNWRCRISNRQRTARRDWPGCPAFRWQGLERQCLAQESGRKTHFREVSRRSHDELE